MQVGLDAVDAQVVEGKGGRACSQVEEGQEQPQPGEHVGCVAVAVAVVVVVVVVEGGEVGGEVGDSGGRGGDSGGGRQRGRRGCEAWGVRGEKKGKSVRGFGWGKQR